VKHNARKRGVACALAVAALVSHTPAWPYQITITAGPKSIYLQVGVGNMTGLYRSGGTPGNNSTVNNVSVSLTSAQIGTGTVAMTTDSPVSTSPYDAFPVCTIPAMVYIGGFYRAPAGTVNNATLTATAPTTLVNSAGQSLPMSSISWTTIYRGVTISSGAFTGGTQTLNTYQQNTWFEDCYAFSYANTSTAVQYGTFSAQVTYTLTSP